MSRSYSLLCYTRKPTKREEANNADVALSMHLTLRSHIASAWTPLNENYGILFAAGVPADSVPAAARRACTAARRFKADRFDAPRPASAAVDVDAVMPDVDIVLKSLKDPYLFRLKDGRFAVAATRTARGGDPDGSEASAFLLVVSRDLTSYDQLGLVRLAGVNWPGVEYDAQSGQYVIRWRDDEGHALYAVVDDIESAVARTVPVAGADRDAATVRHDAACYGIDDVVPGNVITISDVEAARLIERFGRVYNTGSSAPTCSLMASLRGPEAREAVRWFADTRADLTYSDGSKATRAVDWDTDALARLADDAAEGRLKPGESRTIRGRIRQTTYPVPFAVERADPSVFAWNFNGKPMFLFIATEDADGNCIDPREGRTHMPLRVADTIEGLSDAAGGREREIDLLVRGDLNSEGRAMTGCFWAPELHVIDGRLSILFMPCFDGEPTHADGTPNDRAGKPDMWTGRCHIMQLKKDEAGLDLDPREPANWTVPEPILGPEGDILNPVQLISLDMTVIGDPYPDFTWGITNTFRFYNFDLSILFQGVHGGDVINADATYKDVQIRNEKYNIRHRWVSESHPGDGRTPTTYGVPWINTDYDVEDASYAALRNITLGYTLPKHISKKIHLKSLRIYVTANNLWFITSKSYRGINPE